MRTISAYQARTNFGELLNLVYYQGDEVVVERKGKPLVKIVKFADKKPKANLLRESAVNRLFGSLRSPWGYVPLEKVRLTAGERLGKRYQPK
jgi:prevent-host-death family protein